MPIVCIRGESSRGCTFEAGRRRSASGTCFTDLDGRWKIGTSRGYPSGSGYQVGGQRSGRATPIEEVISIGAGSARILLNNFSPCECSGVGGSTRGYVRVAYFFNAPPETETASEARGDACLGGRCNRPGLGWVGLDATAGAYTDDRYRPCWG
jgi:hypothetical protein